MKKPQIQTIIPHFVPQEQASTQCWSIADFHAQLIASRLAQLHLTPLQKCNLIDQIIRSIHS